MRLLSMALMAVFGAIFLGGTGAKELVPEAQIAQEAPLRGAQVEQIMIPIYGRWFAPNQKPYFGAASEPEVFREIQTLSKAGLVQNAGQAPPKLRVLEEFFVPATGEPKAGDDLFGYYVYVVECTRSDLKHVFALPPLK